MRRGLGEDNYINHYLIVLLYSTKPLETSPPEVYIVFPQFDIPKTKAIMVKILEKEIGTVGYGLMGLWFYPHIRNMPTYLY